MSLGVFRSIFMPYCIQKQLDGRYAVLNRKYKPVGFHTADHLAYEEYPILVKFKGLTKAKAAKISFNGSNNVDEIYLYNDGCVPTHTKQDMQAYLTRLEVLANLTIV